MQSLKKNWLVVSNMTWGIWWIFTQPLGSFCPKCAYSLYTLFVQRFELQKYRGIIFHDTKQWYKIWINPDLVVSKMAWAIGWTFIRALKCLKNYTLVDSFCPKHIMFQLENFRGVCVMTLKGDAKFKGKLTYGLKNDIRNLVNFHASSRKSENLHFDGLLLSKIYKDWDENVQKSYVLWHWRVMQSLKKNWLLVPKMTWEIWWILMGAVESLLCYFTWRATFVESILCLS